MLLPAARVTGLPRRIGYALMLGAVATGLAVAGWPAAAAGPVTVMNRVAVVVTVALAAGLPLLGRRFFGPADPGRPARTVRTAGIASVLVLAAIEVAADRSQAIPRSRPAWLASAWTGEIIFLVVIAAYLTGLLAVTSRRSPVGRAALGIGATAGAGAGLIMTVLPPVGNHVRFNGGWLRALDGTARILVIPFLLGTVVAVGLAAARRSSDRISQLSDSDVRARQGVAAGACAGLAAALALSVVAISASELRPHQVQQFQWALPVDHTPQGYRNVPQAQIYTFMVDLSDSAAGYLSVLVLFPLLGAGLGAWGGMCAGGPSGRRRGGGRGDDDPPAGPPPPADGVRPEEQPVRALLSGGYLTDLPPVDGLGPAPGETGRPGRREKAPGREKSPVGG